MTPVTPEDDRELDALLQDIDDKLRVQISRLKKKQEVTPTTGFNVKDLKRTQQAFQTLAEEDFSLEDSRDVPIIIPEKKPISRPTTLIGKIFGGGSAATI